MFAEQDRRPEGSSRIEQGFSAPQKASIASLTGIRGVAALGVMFYHISSFGPEFGLPFLRQIPLLKIGWTGVDLFFLLSGFILFYVHGEEFRRLNWTGLRAFAVLRIFRVYPLATAALLIILVVVVADPGFAHWYPAIHNPGDLTPVAFVRTLFLATRWYPPFIGDWNQPTWSLSAEIVGYCAFPFVALLITRYVNALAAACLAFVAIALPMVIKMLIKDYMDDDLFGFALVRMAGYFTGGMALCRLYRLTPRLNPQIAGWLEGGALAIIVAVSYLPAATGLIAFAFGLLIFSLAFGVGVIDRCLSSPLAMFLGRISFPLYLIHVMALMWLRYFIASRHLGWPFGALCLLPYLAVVVGAAYALHLLIERPFQRWSHKLAGRRLPDRQKAHSTRVA